MTDMTAAELVALVRRGAATGLNLTAHRVVAVTTPLTPIEYGDLRSSLTVIPADVDNLEAAVASDLPYAVRQHEDLSLHHEGGQAKYLEVGTDRSVDDAARIMVTAVRRELGG